MRIFSKTAIRFKNPNVSIIGPTNEDTQFQNINNQVNFDDLYFDTVPDTIQTAPDWINKEDKHQGLVNFNTFNRAVKHDQLIVMPDVASTGASSIAEQAAAADRIDLIEHPLGGPANMEAAAVDRMAKADNERRKREESLLDSSLVKTRRRG